MITRSIKAESRRNRLDPHGPQGVGPLEKNAFIT